MRVWRIGYCTTPVPPIHVLHAELGMGATMGSGRWHRKSGRMMVYAASSRALANLEKRVHCNGVQPVNQALFGLVLPDGFSAIEAEVAYGLPADWEEKPNLTQSIGMEWLESGRSLAMWVPSVVAKGDRNMLINPSHPEYVNMKVELEMQPFMFDDRLF